MPPGALLHCRSRGPQDAEPRGPLVPLSCTSIATRWGGAAAAIIRRAVFTIGWSLRIPLPSDLSRSPEVGACRASRLGDVAQLCDPCGDRQKQWMLACACTSACICFSASLRRRSAFCARNARTQITQGRDMRDAGRFDGRLGSGSGSVGEVSRSGRDVVGRGVVTP